MGKGKEWLEEEIRKNSNSYPTYHDERDGLIKKMVDMHGVIKLIDQLEEPEKVVIPQFVADWLKERKEHFKFAYDASTYISSCGWDDETHIEYKLYKWLPENLLTFCRAWESGYTIEREKRYKVRLKLPVLRKPRLYLSYYQALKKEYTLREEETAGVFTESELAEIDETGFERVEVTE